MIWKYVRINGRNNRWMWMEGRTAGYGGRIEGYGKLDFGLRPLISENLIN